MYNIIYLEELLVKALINKHFELSEADALYNAQVILGCMQDGVNSKSVAHIWEHPYRTD